MQFRSQGEPIAPAYFKHMPGLLLAFVVFSALAHGLSLLLSVEPILQPSKHRLGTTIISTVLAPVNDKPAATPSRRKSAPPPAINVASNVAREMSNPPSIIHTPQSSIATAVTIAKAIPVETPKIDPVLTSKEKTLLRQAITIRQTATTTNNESSSKELFAKQKSQQREQQRNYLLGEIQNRLDRYLTYPIRARKRGWQGEVTITLNINERGQLNNVHLAKSSGYSLLDRSAVTAIRKLKNISLPNQMGQLQSMDLQLPVRYELSEG